MSYDVGMETRTETREITEQVETWICDLCGKSFRDRHGFIMHLWSEFRERHPACCRIGDMVRDLAEPAFVGRLVAASPRLISGSDLRKTITEESLVELVHWVYIVTRVTLGDGHRYGRDGLRLLYDGGIETVIGRDDMDAIREGLSLLGAVPERLEFSTDGKLVLTYDQSILGI